MANWAEGLHNKFKYVVNFPKIGVSRLSLLRILRMIQLVVNTLVVCLVFRKVHALDFTFLLSHRWCFATCRLTFFLSIIYKVKFLETMILAFTFSQSLSLFSFLKIRLYYCMLFGIHLWWFIFPSFVITLFKKVSQLKVMVNTNSQQLVLHMKIVRHWYSFINF